MGRKDSKSSEWARLFRFVGDIYADWKNFMEGLVSIGIAVRYDAGNKNARGCK